MVGRWHGPPWYSSSQEELPKDVLDCQGLLECLQLQVTCVGHLSNEAAEDLRMFWSEGLHNPGVLTLFFLAIDGEYSSSSYCSSAV